MVRVSPRRKRTPRLKCFDYKGQYAYSITVCTYANTPVFNEERVVKTVLESLVSICSKERFRVLAYCFMPDHLHLLLAGEEKGDLVKTIKTFKQSSSHRFKKAYGKPLWQRGYYDHVLRKEEGLEIVANYIWGNPVRKGLAGTIVDYPFSGPREYMVDKST